MSIVPVIELLNILATLSPLAVIALLGVIIFILVKGKSEVNSKVETIGTNHLHDLPGMASDIRCMTGTLSEIAKSLQRIEISMATDFSYIKAKLTGDNRGRV